MEAHLPTFRCFKTGYSSPERTAFSLRCSQTTGHSETWSGLIIEASPVRTGKAAPVSSRGATR